MEILEKARKLAKQSELMRANLQSVFQDKELPFHSRWEAYVLWTRYFGGNTVMDTWTYWDNLVPGLGDIFSYHGIVHVDRYATVDLLEALESLQEALLSHVPGLLDSWQASMDELPLYSLEFTTEEVLEWERRAAQLHEDFWERNSAVLEPFQEVMMERAVSHVVYDW